MARPARHKIELSERERSELTRMARAEKRPWQEVQRARIVLYAAAGVADTEIAARLDTTAGIVGKWRRRFFHDRLDGLRRAFTKRVMTPWSRIPSAVSSTIGGHGGAVQVRDR